MKIIYVLIISIVAVVHIYTGFDVKVTSPLDSNLILLLLIPFLILAWEDAERIKFSSKGVEVEKLKQDANKTIKSVAHGDSVDRKSLETLFKSADANDWLKLVLSRMLMRKGLVAVIPEHNLGSSPSLAVLIERCFKEGKITSQEKEDLEKLRAITYYAEWWTGDVPTHEEWNWAIENSPAVIQKLYDKQAIA